MMDQSRAGFQTFKKKHIKWSVWDAVRSLMPNPFYPPLVIFQGFIELCPGSKSAVIHSLKGL